MDLYGDFKEYAQKHMGITSLQLHYWEQLQDRLYSTTASATPYIIEERELRATVIDIFSRLMMDRIIWLVGPVNDRMSTVVQAQLMYLDNTETKDITLHINSPGGNTTSGRGIIDVINYIESDIVTINTGMAASMGSLLLGAGTRGKRYSLPSAKVMLHQVSHGYGGNIQDTRIALKEAEKENKVLMEMLAAYTNKNIETILESTNRDYWLTAEESKEFGIIDGIITKKSKK